MNKKIFIFFLGSLLGCFSISAVAYEISTHGAVTNEAYKRSVLNDEEFLKKLGVDLSVNPGGPIGAYYDVSGAEVKERRSSEFEDEIIQNYLGVQPLTVSGWLMRGVIREDDCVSHKDCLGGNDDPYIGSVSPFLVFDNRPVHHFYDPIHHRALTLLNVPLEWWGIHKSPDWAIGASDVFSDLNRSENNRRNHFTVFDAREAMYRALTGKKKDGTDDTYAVTEEGRKKYWATLFRSLGDVVHHVQDMAQPQHTRNDPHAGEHFDDPPEIKGHKSVYEAYINARTIGKEFTTVGFTNPASPELTFRPPGLNFGNYTAPRFTDYRSFFTTRAPSGGDDVLTRQGMADFSNRSFFSAGTNLGTSEYRYPKDLLTNEFQELYADWKGNQLPEGSSAVLLLGKLPEKEQSIPLTTIGLFDQFLQQYGTHQFTLTRTNYDAAADELIPRAVAYSAGLINYFFRGKLEAKDAEFVDDKVRLKLKNAIDPKVTPAWANENWVASNSDGKATKLVLAYEYKDASGEKRYGATESTDLNESIAPGRTSQNTYSLALAKPIPQGATDIKYRVVARGKLGQEDDAVAVSLTDPVSGFLATPNYTPADGINGPRMFYELKDQWRLDAKLDRKAGNIDWKGWYEGNRATQVLTWMGPSTRYIAERKSRSNGVWRYSSDFSVQVFKGGELFAVAPFRVLGAALTKDADGEWLVVICNNGSTDIAYRRPNEKSDSAALYDPVTNPKGWVQIGDFQYPNMDAAVPWFFNADGTEAQTMRPLTEEKPNRLARLMVTIQNGAAKFENPIENGQGLATTYTYTSSDWTNPTLSGCTPGNKVTDKRSWTSTEQRSGEYVIAVDYKINTPVTGKIVQSGSANWTNSYSYDLVQVSCNPTVARKDGETNFSGSSDLKLDLILGNRTISIIDDHRDGSGDSQWSNRPDYDIGALVSATQNFSGKFKKDDLYYFDLRHDVYVTNEFNSVSKSQDTLSNQTLCQSSEQTINTVDRLFDKSEIPRNPSTRTVTTDPNPYCQAWNPLNGFPVGYVADGRNTTVYEYPTASWVDGRRSGAVSANGALFFSGNIKGYTPVLNYVDGIDPGQPIGGAPSDALYEARLLK